jgi:GntR family transcriptional repressor for pyruvate dehydrogenase complex
LLSPGSRTSVSADTVEQIAAMIRAGEYAAGDRLPGERILAKQFQVSRASVREALRTLTTIGLLETRQGLGTFIKDPSQEILQASLPPPILTNQDTLEKVFEIRQLIEVEAAALAAQRVDANQITVIKHWLQAVETHIARDEMEDMVTADIEFHHQIIVATGNDILVSLMDSISDLLRDMRWDTAKIPELLTQITTGHQAIFKAIETGNPDAARQAMQAHLDGISARVKNFWIGEKNADE